jgi:NADH-quinone oxidoreductase subunit J
MINKIFFFYFATAIVLLAMATVTRRNAVHAVLYMLALFFHTAALYLFLNAEFIAAIQVIVYAGAIMVLFLFVVMLLNLKEDIRREHFIGVWPAGLAAAVGMLVVFAMTAVSAHVGTQGQWSIEAIKKATHTKALGELLYTKYLLPFEVASLVLLIAIIGAIVLAKTPTKKPKRLKD